METFMSIFLPNFYTFNHSIDNILRLMVCSTWNKIKCINWMLGQPCDLNLGYTYDTHHGFSMSNIEIAQCQELML